MSAETIIQQIIDAATAISNDAADEARGFSEDGITAAGSVITLDPIPSVTQPTRITPQLPPTSDEAEDRFRTTFNELYNQLGPEFATQYEAMKARFFPEIDDCLQEKVDDWLCSTIENGGTGIPTDVEDQIWERSRAREQRDHARKVDEIRTGWAGRGFALPAGTLFDAEQRAEQELSEKISTHSRDVAIKQIDVEIENIRFAVGKSIELRLGGLAALSQYMNTWLGVSKLSVDYANGILHGRQAFYGALAAYYNSLIAMERLIYDWGKDRAEMTVQQQNAFVALVNNNTASRVNAAVSAATAAGSRAAAALAAQNTLAQISNNTEITG